MLDQMSMPVAFGVLIAVLAVVIVGFLLVLRVVGERSRDGGKGEPTPPGDEPPH